MLQRALISSTFYYSAFVSYFRHEIFLFQKVSIACILCSCLRSFYYVDIKISLLNCFEYKHSIFFSINFSILSRLRANLIFIFLNYNHILLLRDIFENDFYKEFSSSSFNFSFENEVISSNSFFIDWKDLIETQYVKDAEEKRTYNLKKASIANFFMHNLIIFSASINLKNIFASRQRSCGILIILK